MQSTIVSQVLTSKLLTRTKHHVSAVVGPGITYAEAFTSITFTEDETKAKNILVAGSRDGFLVTIDLSGFESRQSGCATCERMGLMPVHVYPGRNSDSFFLCCDLDFILASGFRHARGFTQKQSVWTIDAEDPSKSSPAITAATALSRSLSGNEANVSLLLVATDHILLADLEPHAGPVQRHIPLEATPVKLLYSHVLKCLIVAVNTSDNRPALRFIDPDTGDDLSLPIYVDDNKKKQHASFISGLGRQGDRILCLEEWHVRSERGHYYYLLVSTRGTGGDKGGRVLVVLPEVSASEKISGGSRGKIRFFTKYKLDRVELNPGGAVSAIAASNLRIVSSVGHRLYSWGLDPIAKKIDIEAELDIGGPAWKLSLLPGEARTLALVKGDSLRVIEHVEEGEELITTHVEDATRSAMDMLEVAGNWTSTPTGPSDPPQSIVLLSDQNCSLTGLWVHWDSPGKDCEVLFEADLPSSVRRLRLGNTLPAWSREARKKQKFGHLPASIDGHAQILGMGIDGSMQSFTLLDLNAWRFLRLVQNLAEMSQELYPFTYVPWEEVVGDPSRDGRSNGTGAPPSSDGSFDPTPVVDRGLEMQVDGDMLLRCLEKRALEGLVKPGPADWYELFQAYLAKVVEEPWTGGAEDEEVMEKWIFEAAYEVLEYYLVPVI